jgi:hypothetical protein
MRGAEGVGPGAARSLEASRTVVEGTALFRVTVSFGSVASLISLPCYMSHASIPAAVRAARGLPDDLVRISVGIEDAGDLLAGAPLRGQGGELTQPLIGLLCLACLLPMRSMVPADMHM